LVFPGQDTGLGGFELLKTRIHRVHVLAKFESSDDVCPAPRKQTQYTGAHSPNPSHQPPNHRDGLLGGICFDCSPSEVGGRGWFGGDIPVVPALVFEPNLRKVTLRDQLPCLCAHRWRRCRTPWRSSTGLTMHSFLSPRKD